MGTRASKQTGEQKAKKEAVKTNAIQSTREKLINLKQTLTYDANSIIPHDQSKEIVLAQSSLLDIAINQVDRGEKQLVKADLIAIILSLKPEYSLQLHELQTQFTVHDLNCLIRTLLYDVSRLKDFGKKDIVIKEQNSAQLDIII